MYFAVIALTMLVLPTCSILVEHGLRPDAPMLVLIGKWFTFWGVGLRLGLAGLRQVLKPEFTAKEIFKLSTEEALPIVRELGFANVATAVIALLSMAIPTFVLPAAISGCILFGAAGLMHAGAHNRSHNETAAMVSDLFIAAVLALYVLATFSGF